MTGAAHRLKEHEDGGPRAHEELQWELLVFLLKRRPVCNNHHGSHGAAVTGEEEMHPPVPVSKGVGVVKVGVAIVGVVVGP